MLDIVAVSARTWAGLAVDCPLYETSLMLFRPYASRVALMFRSIERASRCWAFGATENCCSTCGHAAPISTLDSTSSTVAMAGSCRLRRNTAAKNAAAQMIEMNSRISFAGITALRSV